MYNELERMWREAVLVWFKVLSRHSFLGTEKNYEKKAIRYSLRQDRYKNIIQKRHCFSQLTWCISFKIGPVRE